MRRAILLVYRMDLRRMEEEFPIYQSEFLYYELGSQVALGLEWTDSDIIAQIAAHDPWGTTVEGIRSELAAGWRYCVCVTHEGKLIGASSTWGRQYLQEPFFGRTLTFADDEMYAAHTFCVDGYRGQRIGDNLLRFQAGFYPDKRWMMGIVRHKNKAMRRLLVRIGGKVRGSVGFIGKAKWCWWV